MLLQKSTIPDYVFEDKFVEVFNSNVPLLQRKNISLISMSDLLSKQTTIIFNGKRRQYTRRKKGDYIANNRICLDIQMANRIQFLLHSHWLSLLVLERTIF